jgi:phosphatidate cytidylyltransferase
VTGPMHVARRLVRERGSGQRTPDSARFADLRARALSGLIFSIVLLLALWWGDAWFLVLLIALTLVAEAELYLALRRSGRRPAIAVGVMGGIGTLLGAAAIGPGAIPLSLLVIAIAASCWFWIGPVRSHRWVQLGWTILVPTWVAGPLAFSLPIAQSRHGTELFLATAAITAALDSGQLLVGRLVGRWPLAPRLSPKKTVEGLLGGAIAAILIALLVARIQPFDFVSAMALAAVIITVGPLGDLAVSWIKRLLGIKDLGWLARGHGGVMDMLDAALFVIPTAWLLFRWLDLLN